MNRTVLLAMTWLVASGCHYSVIGKRKQEVCCPTDIRKTYYTPWGEDAVFETPCCPDEAYHGHKPTCWREWQAPAEVWRDEYCGPQPVPRELFAAPEAGGMLLEESAQPAPYRPSTPSPDVRGLPPVEAELEPLPPEVPPIMRDE